MAKSEKKVVKATRKNKKVVTPTRSTRKTETAGVRVAREPEELIFGKDNLLWMGIGVVVIALGMILMLGGSQPDSETWDPNIIYSFRITVLAPIVILAGLAIEIYAIFKK